MEKKPYISGVLNIEGKDHYIAEGTWFGLIKKINDIMMVTEITFPLGEGDEMVNVTQKVTETEKFK